jgi:hypothetical protein
MDQISHFLFGVPYFLVPKNSGPVPPLTSAEKFKITARYSVDPIEFLRYGAQAGISQAFNHDAGYGQEASGYGKRVAERAADGTLESFCTQAIFPSLLHQDPRYYQSHEGGWVRRAGHAFSHMFVTRSDAGATQFNFSEIAGGATAAGIAAFTYHPHGERTSGMALQIWGTHVAFDGLRFGIMEFWPDIRHKLSRTK